MRVELSPRASAEIQRAAEWYDDQRTGLGEDFVAELKRALLLIEEAPRRYPTYGRQKIYRRLRLVRFPYQVIYEEDEELAWVIAVAHERQEPTF